MDILYPLKRTKDNKELLYSLRSLQNIKHNRVFIVGDLPAFQICNINHIPANSLDSKYITTTNHIQIACESDISDDFILMNDDFYFLKSTTIEDLNIDRGFLKDQIEFYKKNHNPLTSYDQKVLQVYNYYKRIGQNAPKSFELHCPIIINKYKFKSILNLLQSESLHCCKRTIYGNMFIKDSKTIEDVKILSNKKMQDKWNDMQFLSSSESMFPLVESFLKQKFPTKSIYEI